MEKLRKVVYLIFCVIAVGVALAALLSIFRDTDSRYLKMLDFPRIQLFIVSIAGLAGFVALTKRWRWYDYALVVGLLGGMFVQAFYLYNYTTLSATTVAGTEGEVSEQDLLSLMVVNVKMKNRQAQSLLDLINEYQPDVLLAMETDAWWDSQLQPIERQYPSTKEVINEVTYGMVLYSRFPTGEVTVDYLQNENVPSMQTTLTLDNGRQIAFHGVHPVPPTRFKRLPDNEGEQEVAMQKVGRKVAEGNLPAIVAGDINDVVWSYTDALTHTEDLLHDVRVGRGFYNTFNAESWWKRWPLDHVFVTDEFRVHRLERLPEVDSDHYPLYVELAIAPND